MSARTRATGKAPSQICNYGQAAETRFKRRYDLRWQQAGWASGGQPRRPYCRLQTDCTPERCDAVTIRSCEPPATEHGPPGSFRPFDVPARAQEVRGLPASPLDLFVQYVPQSLVEQWAQWTNAAPLSREEGPRARRARVYEWRKTSADEMYLFLGILLYIGIYRESRLSTYWSTQQQREDPIHLFTRFISRDRFQLLLQRLRIFNSAEFQPVQPSQPSQSSQPSQGRGRGQGQGRGQMPDVYRKVNQWSAHIQETGDSFYTAGSDLTVDEAM
ncbi:pep1, partial [Colletotrichum incanum]